MTRSDLAIALAGLEPAAFGHDDLTAQITWAANAGFCAIRLNVLQPGTHPRDLDRSARRGLAALLRRLELRLHGLDVWIPPEHLVRPDRQDRAVSAIVRSIELADELSGLLGMPGARPTIGCTLPTDLPDGIAGTLDQTGARLDVPVADHTWPFRDHPTAHLSLGIDPATLLLNADESPQKLIARMSANITCIRLSDAAQHGRVEPGSAEGRLDLMTFAATVSLGGGTNGGGAAGEPSSAPTVVLDLRGVTDQPNAVTRVLDRWPGVLR